MWPWHWLCKRLYGLSSLFVVSKCSRRLYSWSFHSGNRVNACFENTYMFVFSSCFNYSLNDLFSIISSVHWLTGWFGLIKNPIHNRPAVWGFLDAGRGTDRMWRHRQVLGAWALQPAWATGCGALCKENDDRGVLPQRWTAANGGKLRITLGVLLV